MDSDIDDGKSNVVNLDGKSLNEMFEIFHLEMDKRNSLDVVVRFHQNGYFAIQDSEVTFWDVRGHSSENINKLGNWIVDFCIKNDIEVVLI